MPLRKCKAGPADGSHQTCAAPYPELLSAAAGASLQPLPACVAEPRAQLDDRSGTAMRCGWLEQAAGAERSCCTRSRQTGMQSDHVQAAWLCEHCVLRQPDRSPGSSTWLQCTEVADAGAAPQWCGVQRGRCGCHSPTGSSIACLHGLPLHPVLLGTAQAGQQRIRHQTRRIWRLPRESRCDA